MTAEQNTDDNIAKHRTLFSEHERPFSEQPTKTAEQNTRSVNAEQRSLPVLVKCNAQRYCNVLIDGILWIVSGAEKIII